MFVCVIQKWFRFCFFSFRYFSTVLLLLLSSSSIKHHMAINLNFIYIFLCHRSFFFVNSGNNISLASFCSLRSLTRSLYFSPLFLFIFPKIKINFISRFPPVNLRLNKTRAQFIQNWTTFETTSTRKNFTTLTSRNYRSLFVFFSNLLSVSFSFLHVKLRWCGFYFLGVLLCFRIGTIQISYESNNKKNKWNS